VKHAIAAVMVLLMTLSPAAQAFDFDTSLRGSIWSRAQDLSGDEGITSAQMWVRSSDAWMSGDAGLKVYGEGWISRQDGGGGDASDRRLREAYGQLSYGPLELRAGWQMFPWGRADGINPTDNLTPRQLTMLTRDLEDQRFGTPALRSTWYSGPMSMSLIWLAGFKPSITPWPTSAPSRDDIRPSDPQDQWAARLELVRDELEGSLSYFDGFDLLPTAASMAPTGTPQVLLQHGRVRIAGADFAKPINRVILRGEVSHTEAPDARSGDIFTMRSQWYGVTGAEETFGEYLDVEVQYYYRKVYGSAVPRDIAGPLRPFADSLAASAQQFDPVDRGFTFRVTDKWLNETLEASFSGVFSVVRSGYLLRPLIDYRATDTWTISLGADIPGGSDKSLYGVLKDDRSVFLELRRGF